MTYCTAAARFTGPRARLAGRGTACGAPSVLPVPLPREPIRDRLHAAPHVNAPVTASSSARHCSTYPGMGAVSLATGWSNRLNSSVDLGTESIPFS